MADNTNDHTVYVDREKINLERPIGTSPLAFIVGGLVIAVLLLVLVFAGSEVGERETVAPTVTVPAPEGNAEVGPLVPADEAEPTAPAAPPAADAN